MTPRQREVLAFFRTFAQREGLPPTIREVARHFNVGPRAASDVLERLARDGHLRHRAGQRAHAFILPTKERT